MSEFCMGLPGSMTLGHQITDEPETLPPEMQHVRELTVGEGENLNTIVMAWCKENLTGGVRVEKLYRMAGRGLQFYHMGYQICFDSAGDMLLFKMKWK